MAKAEKKTVKEDAQATAAAQTLQTKSAMMSGVLAAMSSMNHDQMMQWFPDAMELASTIGGDEAAKNAATLQMKPSAATGGVVKEETLALFEGEELKEEAKERFLTLIEHAVDIRVSVEKEMLEEQYQQNLIEEAARIQEEFIEKIDGYATYAAEQWVEKNEVAIESAIRLEKAERLIEGLKGLFAECSIEIPEEKADYAENLQAYAEELEAKLNEQIDETIALRESVVRMTAMAIFNEVSEGLTPIETEKFKKLVEDIEVDIPAEDLQKKLQIVKEAHFKAVHGKPAAITEAVELNEEQKKLQESKQEVIDPVMGRYVDAISRASRDRYAPGGAR